MFVITGGGSGIGSALALKLAQRGESVLIVGRREANLSLTASQSPLINWIVADVTDELDRQRVIKTLKDLPIKGLIHNAGIIDPIKPLSKINEAEWFAVMSTNVTAPLLLTQYLLKQLTQGRVLVMSSGAAHFPVVGWGAYCVSKAAVDMLTQCWQLEVNTTAFARVMPGIIDTPMQAVIRESNDMDNEKHDFFLQLKQQQKLIKPEAVALFLTWLLLDVHASEFSAHEWDIYDKKHHAHWLTAPHSIPALEN